MPTFKLGKTGSDFNKSTMEWINSILIEHSVIQAVVVIAMISALGLALGKISVYGVSLGVTFVFFVGIAAGHFGLSIDPQMLNYAESFGLIIFVYDKVDDSFNRTSRLNICHTIYVEAERTADYQLTKSINDILDNTDYVQNYVVYVQESEAGTDDVVVKVGLKTEELSRHKAFTENPSQ